MWRARRPAGRPWPWFATLGWWAWLGLALSAGPAWADGRAWFERFLPSDEWQTKFWANPDAQALLKLDPPALANLVPKQAGLRYCRCPACGAGATTDPLAWSARKPEVVTCRACQASFPNDTVPARDKDKDKKIPEETVDVAPGVTHHYPYHVPEADKQQVPDERLYLDARRDYEARAFLSRAAFYAAGRVQSQKRTDPQGAGRSPEARLAAVLLLRFAQVYPFYALHLDGPNSARSLEAAYQPPPYRRHYGTGKWDSVASANVPVNLALAYAVVRGTPALSEAGQLLKDLNPARTIEDRLFRASVGYALAQHDEADEASLLVDRGVLVVGRLLHDQALIGQATRRLQALGERSFTLDGLWRGGDPATHARVLDLLDGWVAPLLDDPASTGGAPDRLALRVGGAGGGNPAATRTLAGVDLPILALARRAGATARLDAPAEGVVPAAWPTPEPASGGAGPALLGGAGLARLEVGQGADALAIELRGMGSLGDGADKDRSRRQALRVAVGGRVVLSDRDDAPRADGFDRASASHNTVLIDDLNQRESPRVMHEAAPGGNFPFFAADADFQVAVQNDPFAYPRLVTDPDGYRQTVVAASGPTTRYAVSVFEVAGGTRHDQFWHGPATSEGDGRWLPSLPTPGVVRSLLDPAIPFVAAARVGDGRWFVQSYGMFGDLRVGLARQPGHADWRGGGGSPLRLHLLTEAPWQVMTATTPIEPTADDPARAALIVRRQRADSSGVAGPLESTFVTVIDPTLKAGGPGAGHLVRAGRMTDTPGFVVLFLETPDGPEHLVINLQPGTVRRVRLADGRELATDGRVVRARRDEVMLAGGTVANLGGVAVRQASWSGRVLGAGHSGADPVPNAGAAGGVAEPIARGWFEVDSAVAANPTLIGRTLHIRHGDGTAHAWTLARIEPVARRRTRLHVREEPGFLLDEGGKTPAARYYQFPQTTSPGPHTWTLSTIAR